MNIFIELGMRIAYLRREKKWSQEDLALESNINRNYISDLERGKRNPSLLILSRIAKALGISLEILFLGVSN